jgi:ferric-dicitrate binding protein FerR (iron transport regulator)
MKEQNSHNDNEVFLAKWLAGELSDEALESLVSETEYISFLKLRKGVQTLEALDVPKDHSLNTIKNRVSTKIKQPYLDHEKVKSLNAQRWILGIAASVILLFGLFFSLDDDMVTITTNYGEQRTVVLLDGSEVILNSKSTLVYDRDNWEDNRKLDLKGEGYFKVKKGSTFTVVTDNGDVNVLGTQFNVNSMNDLFEVVCFEGKVSVLTKKEKYTLLPAHTVRRINGFEAEQWETRAVNPTWINGESTFKSVPLKYVIESLEAQYNIIIHAKRVNTDLIYTGSFTHKDLNTALKTIFNSLQIRYIEKEKGNIYLSTK